MRQNYSNKLDRIKESALFSHLGYVMLRKGVSGKYPYRKSPSQSAHARSSCSSHYILQYPKILKKKNLETCSCCSALYFGAGGPRVRNQFRHNQFWKLEKKGILILTHLCRVDSATLILGQVHFLFKGRLAPAVSAFFLSFFITSCSCILKGCICLFDPISLFYFYLFH